MYVFKALGSAPSASEHPNAARWYTHIQSWSPEHDTLPGSSTAGEAFTGAASTASAAGAAAPEKPADDDDDEVDLFGSDDEEDDAEAERIKAERVAAYNAKKAGKPKTVAKVSFAKKKNRICPDGSNRCDGYLYTVCRDPGGEAMG